ncbi:MAG: hypothetical protein IJF21_03630 [Clostridia bacterium]|nr:hypothetical protein [Clostridia bacterium]MBQ3229180.1 hypothetical protein [Clostridia bacterium]
MDEKLYADLAAATKYYLIGNEFEDRIQKENKNIQTLSAYPENNKRKKTESSILMCKIGKWIAIPNGIFLLLCGIVAMAGVEPDASDKILLPIMGIALIVSIIIATAAKSKTKRIEKECDDEFESHIKPQIEESQSNLITLKQNLSTFAKDNHHVVEFLPASYRNPQATSYMLLAVSNGRADTLKEAINLYEEQLHRWKLEQYARQGAEAQEYCALAMDELNSRQAQTNAHLQAIEIMQFVNFITK